MITIPSLDLSFALPIPTEISGEMGENKKPLPGNPLVIDLIIGPVYDLGHF